MFNPGAAPFHNEMVKLYGKVIKMAGAFGVRSSYLRHCSGSRVLIYDLLYRIHFLWSPIPRRCTTS